jgi:hypothetical protein
MIRVDPPQRETAEEIDAQVAGGGVPDQIHAPDVGPDAGIGITVMRFGYITFLSLALSSRPRRQPRTLRDAEQ